jgi:hypothetical protein
MLWALAAAMGLLIGAWGILNRRAGYRRPPRRALLEEGFRLLRRFEHPLPLKPTAPPSGETPVEQLVNLSLAVQSAAQEPALEPVEDSETIHSPT